MPESATSVITDEMRAAVGVESAPTTLEVTTSGIRLFARAVGYTDPIFYDEAAAREQGCSSLVAPPGFMGTPVYRPGSGAGMPAARFEVPYKRFLNGGTTYEYLEPIVAGDVITSRSRLTELREREGSMGPMLIVYSETVYTRGDGTVVAKSRGNLIHY
jgi:acyl dehydratase